jgi:hypothetical protein
VRGLRFRRLTYIAVIAVLGLATVLVATSAVADNAAPAAKKKKKKKRSRSVRVRVVCPKKRVLAGQKPLATARKKKKTFTCRARIKRGKRGRRGKAGPAGPTPGSSAFFGRSFVPMTNDFIGDTGGNTVKLASVGDVNIIGLCRKSHPDDNPGPIDNSEEEAKVLIQSDHLTTTFGSGQGWRKNVPSGPIEYILDTQDYDGSGNQTGTHSLDNPQGEGEHQFLAASTSADWSPGDTSNNHDEDRVTPSGWPAYRNAGGWVWTDFGEFKLDVGAGINAAGIGDRCGFAGIITNLP